MSTNQILREVQRLAREFNCYFNSGNAIEVPARVSVPRDQWRQLFAEIQALSLPATEKASAGSEPVGRVRIDSGEVHIVPFVRDAEISDLRAGQQVHAAPVSQPAPADQFRDAAQMIGADDKWNALYFHAHRLIDGIGHHGEISSKCDAVEQLERALSDLDGGEYRHGLKPPYQAPDVKPAAVVRSVEGGEVRVKWLAGFPQIGDRLFYRSAPSPLPGLSGLLEQVLDVLEESRDDVLSELQRAKELAGYPSTDRRLKAVQAQLQRHDSILAVVRASLSAKQQVPKLSDDELDALRQADNGALNFVTLREFRVIARAVLAALAAKKGQPT